MRGPEELLGIDVGLDLRQAAVRLRGVEPLAVLGAVGEVEVPAVRRPGASAALTVAA